MSESPTNGSVPNAPDADSGIDTHESNDDDTLDVVVSIQHPAHVHFFRNAIADLEDRGHNVHIFAREKDIAIELLEAYDLDHEVLAGQTAGLTRKAIAQLAYEWRVLKHARRIGPDVMMAIGEPAVVHAATVLGCRSVVFTDTEHATYRKRFVYPMADQVCSPEYYQDHIGDNHIKYPGYHELAYLHPNRFTPNSDTVAELGVDPDDKLVVLRLVSWEAAHDIGDSGIDDVGDVIERLENAGATVAVTAEGELPPDLAEYEITTLPENVHDLLAHADLFIGESATMATESAVLGTPAILITTIRGMGNVQELRDEYGLVFSYSAEDRHQRSVERAVEILDEGDDERWERRRERLLSDKIDTTTFVTTLVENEQVGQEVFQKPALINA